MTDEEIREIRTKALKDDLASINNRLHHAFNQGFELGRKSTTPKEKTGHWEYVQYDGNPNIGNLHCSECERIAGFEYNFCPNCGAKMEVENDG